MMKTLIILLLLVCVGHSASNNMTNQELEELSRNIGKTKSGAPCRIVAKANIINGVIGVNTTLDNMEQFVMRQNRSAPISTCNKFGCIYYDCFLDIDTEEFKLHRHDLKKEDDQLSLTFSFGRRIGNGTCDHVEYEVLCHSAANKTMESCTVNRECIVYKPVTFTVTVTETTSMMAILAWSVLFALLFICLFVSCVLSAIVYFTDIE